MNALAIIKAYETLKSHGLVNTIVGFEGVGLNKESKEILENYIAATIGKKPTLCSITHKAPTSLKDKTTQNKNTHVEIVKFYDLAREHNNDRPLIIQSENISSKTSNSPSSHVVKSLVGDDDNLKQIKEDELSSKDGDCVVNKKKLKDLTITKLLELKMMVDNVYNIGTLDNTVGADIIGIATVISKQVLESRVHVIENK